jgi:hypothetical protein
MAIGFILRGQKQDIIILADSLQEAKKEMKKHQKDIKKYVGAPVLAKTKASKRKAGKVSISTLILELKEEGFFKQPQGSNAIQKKLASRGHHYPATSLTAPLQRLVRNRELGRVPDGKRGKYVQR